MLKILRFSANTHPFSANTHPSATYRTNVHLLRNSSVSERATPPTQLRASSFSNVETEWVRFFLGHARDGTRGLMHARKVLSHGL